MRNLKRALSLALASVMVLGLMVVGSGASYKDVSSEQNQEAIEVLQAVGIMVGDDNGNFNPDQNVTRNEMAVIMSNLMDYRVATYKGTSPFTDVPAWAEPYVAACWTNGITAGYDATTYGGNDTVTTAQAALMVMKALGYFQYQSDFENDWMLATVSQANKIDLFDDVESGVREAMTRNDVAQLVLNTLEAGTVEADDNTIKVETGDTKVEAGKVKYNYVTSSKDYADAISDAWPTSSTNSTAGYIVELGEKLYNGDLTKKDDQDDFGRPASIWEYDSKEIGTYADGADYTYTAKITSKTLYNDLGSTVAKNYDWFIFVDGEEPVNAGKVQTSVLNNKSENDTEFIKMATGTDYTGNGTLTEVFVDTDEKEVYISIINTYAAEVLKVNEKDGTITLSALSGDARISDTFETTGYEEDDVVLYTYAGNEIKSVAPATRMEGTVSRVRLNTATGNETSGDNFVADGTTYKYTFGTGLASTKLTSDNVDNDVVAYLDAYGYVIYIDYSETKYDYAYVLSVGSEGNKYGDDAKATAYARLILTDGTMAKVELDNTLTEANALKGTLVSYTVDKDDIYTLSSKTNYALSGGVSVGDTIVENGKAKISGLTSSVTADKNTVFVLVDPDTKLDDYDISIYTGIDNVPDVDVQSGTVATAVTKSNSTVAKVVYIQDGDVGGSGQVIFAIANSSAKLQKDSENGSYYEIDAVVDGAKTTLNVKSSTTAADKLVKDIGTYFTVGQNATKISDTKQVVALKSYNENSDGFVTSVTVYEKYTTDDGALSQTATLKAEDGTVGLGGTRYAYSDDAVVARYTTDDKAVVMSRINSVKNDDNDKVLAIMDDTVVTGLFIVEVDGDTTSGGSGSGEQTGSNYTASYTVAPNGLLRYTLTYTAPDFAAKTATATMDLVVYADGVYCDTVPVSKAMVDGKFTVSGNAAGLYNSTDKITFVLENEKFDEVVVKYVDAAGEAMNVAGDETAKNGTLKVAISNTEYAGNFKITKIDGATTTTPLPTGNVGVGAAGTDLAIVIDGTKAVTVTIDKSSLTAPTFTVTGVNEAALSDLKETGKDTNFNGTRKDLTVTVTASKTSGIASGETVAVQAKAAGSVSKVDVDEKPVKVTLDIGGKEFVLVYTNDNTTEPSVVDTITVTGKVTVTVKSVVELSMPTVTRVVANDKLGNGFLDKDSTTGVADTITVYFSEKVTGPAAPAISGTATLTFDSGVLADDGMSATYTVTGSAANANTSYNFDFAQNVLKGANGTNNALIGWSVKGLTFTAD